MVTKKNHVAFNLMVAVAFATILAGCKPAGPKALLDGKRLLEQGRASEAIERLQVATDLMRTNAQAWNYLGVAYHQAGQSVNASNAYVRALHISHDLMEARLNLGRLYSEQGRPGEAKSEFNTYTLSRPNSAEGFQCLAAVEVQLREFPQAELHVRRALQLDGDNAESLNTLGMVQLQRARPHDATQSFAAALKKRPGYAAALLNLAIVKQQLGERAEALKLYRQYIDLTPRPAEADSVKAVIQQLEAELAPAPVSPVAPLPITPPVTQMAVAKPIVTNPVVSKPVPPPAPVAKPEPVVTKPVVAPAPPVRPPPTVVTLAPEPVIRTTPVVDAPVVATPPKPAPKPVETTGTVNLPPPSVAPKTEKRSIFQNINPANVFRSSKPVTPLPNPQGLAQPEPVAARPVTPGPQEVAGSPANQLPEPPPPAPPIGGTFARYTYVGAGKTAPGDRTAAQVFASKGSDAMASKRFSDATAAFRSAAEADPSWFQAHLNHSAAALQAGRVTESLRAGEAALSLKPDSSEARYNFALALKQGNYIVDAAIELERLLILKPDDADAHLTLGNIYAEQLRQPDKARAHYLRVLELKPGHPRSTAIRFWLKANPQ